ncbi:hypothetical protein G6F22_021429 [Rhizopus arrhizus]|nr:hypothetical protein G6F22_021429 [Rhizopus arrhizus]
MRDGRQFQAATHRLDGGGLARRDEGFDAAQALRHFQFLRVGGHGLGHAFPLAEVALVLAVFLPAREHAVVDDRHAIGAALLELQVEGATQLAASGRPGAAARG